MVEQAFAPVPPPAAPYSIVPPPPMKIGAFRASFVIARESLSVIAKDKEILLFSVFSILASVISVAIMVAGVLFFNFGSVSVDALQSFADAPSQEQGEVNTATYAFILVMTILTMMAINFFEACIYIVAHERFNGRNATFGDGIRGASSRLDRILLWSLIASTVGFVLQRVSERSKIIGKIMARLGGAAWNILTYFMLPALVLGQSGFKDTFKDSAELIRRRWGEVAIVWAGTSGLSALLVGFGFVMFFALLMLFAQDLFGVIVIAVLFVAYIIGIIVLSSALGSVFKLALYEYASTGIVPEGFSPEIVQAAFRTKKK